MKRFTIIGGGASGTLLALNLLRYQGDRRLEVNLVEKRPHLGRGVAFSTEQDVHLLNVPAAKMGAYPDEVEHFHSWLCTSGLECQPNAFVPRRIFGEYLREQLEEANQKSSANVTLNVYDDEAVDIEMHEGKVSVHLVSGDHIFSEKAVLAFGNFLPPHPSVPDQSFASSPKYFQDPWSPGVIESTDQESAVLIVGTGLSMVDVTMQLYRSGHRGLINAISTRGQLPAVHKLGYTYPSFYDEIKGVSRVTDILKTVRAHAQKADSNGSDWRAVIDSLRPVTQQIWLDLRARREEVFHAAPQPLLECRPAQNGP